VIAALPTWFVVALLVACALAAYHNSFFVPLLFDDAYAVMNNPSIGDLRNLGAVLAPPADTTTGGRPMLNLSFALNYALHGLDVRGYHVVNLALHIVAALALFGLTERTLRATGRYRRDVGRALAFMIAALWLLHPLHTATVTYISQRAEGLMGLCYLLTLYCFARGAEEPRQGLWPWLSVIACALGMLTKETMVTAPLLVLLYDRAFWSLTWRDALQRRVAFYAGLAATWLLLAGLLLNAPLGARGVGYDGNVTAWTYLLTQSRVILGYVKLTLWPDPLVFDYGQNRVVTSVGEVWPHLLAIVAMLGGAVMAWRRWPPLGFLGVAFFLILAPTSSIVPIVYQPMAENRVYLSAAAIVAFIVLGAHATFGRRHAWLLGGLAIVLGFATGRRNGDYSSAIALWSDTVRKRPDNVRAHNHLAEALRAGGDVAASRRHSERALQLQPENPEAHNNLGVLLAQNSATVADAVAHYEAALRARPKSAVGHTNLGNALLQLPGRLADAEAHLREAIRCDPRYAEAYTSLGNVLIRKPGAASEALQAYGEVVRLRPKDPTAHSDFAFALAVGGRVNDASHHAAIALALDPRHAGAHVNLANALMQIPYRRAEAISHYREALKVRPDFPEAWANLGIALLGYPGSEREAIAALEQALKLRPDFPQAKEALQRAREKVK
jgi:protein O-mannosyl-transferase